jgi:hypothetical protein
MSGTVLPDCLISSGVLEVTHVNLLFLLLHGWDNFLAARPMKILPLIAVAP